MAKNKAKNTATNKTTNKTNTGTDTRKMPSFTSTSKLPDDRERRDGPGGD
ncbi:hypothetical protein [Anaerocolumna sp. MB42-C2]|nr:hypothetical protein [Anaerocolumna sp. MB42-C2]WMJ87938.1 hypothetical protein RBU59_00055 [Anaerocolumna sp. MB42-C2]